MGYSIRFDKLPDDMQQLITDYTEFMPGFDGDYDKLNHSVLSVRKIPTKAFPFRKPVNSEGEMDNRDAAHAMVVPIDPSVPVVLSGSNWIDGRHRVYRAKKERLPYVYAIDLNELGYGPVVLHPGSYLGRIKT